MFSSVAGVSAPAFVERNWQGLPLLHVMGVSLAFRRQPSLSGFSGGSELGCIRVSLAFRRQPSLSALAGRVRSGGSACVAGASAPSFVERSAGYATSRRPAAFPTA